MVLREKWKLVELYLDLIGVVAVDQARVLNEIKAKRLQNRDKLHATLVWQKGNIVEGPGRVNHF
jgi:hypothetical protein